MVCVHDTPFSNVEVTWYSALLVIRAFAVCEASDFLCKLLILRRVHDVRDAVADVLRIVQLELCRSG